MKKMLLIEDDSDLFALLSTTWKKKATLLIGQQTGKGAIECAGRERPDLILLDIMLPDSDGLDICKGIRSHPELARSDNFSDRPRVRDGPNVGLEWVRTTTSLSRSSSVN